MKIIQSTSKPFVPTYDHEQIQLGEFTVDRKIYNLVRALNNCGLITAYSCEGYPRRLGRNLGLSKNITSDLSHVIFNELDHAYEFFKYTSDKLGAMWDSREGSLLRFHTLMAYEERIAGEPMNFKSTGARGVVHFNPHKLAEVTEVWMRRDGSIAIDEIM